MATCGPCDQRGLLRVGCCGLAHPHRGGQRTRSVRVYRPAEVNMARIDSVIVQQQRSAGKKLLIWCRFSHPRCACLFVMKMHLITLIVAASAVVHAHAGDLASQLEGYWKPDLEKTGALAKKAGRNEVGDDDPMAQALVGRMVFEFQNGKVTVHPPLGGKFEEGSPPLDYKVIAEDKAAKALTLRIDGKETKIRFDKEQMAMSDKKEGGWMILNRMSKEDFAKRKPALAEMLKEGSAAAPAAEKLEDISDQPIPDKPATGKVRGKDFKIEMAKLEDGSLVLRQGEVEEFEITFRGEKVGNYAGKTFTVKPDQQNTGFGIELAFSREPGSFSTSTTNRGFAMRLEFGTAKKGKIPGKIHLRLPDAAGSFVVGTFLAEIK